MITHLTDSSGSGIDGDRTMLASFMRKSSYIFVIASIISIVCYVILGQLSPQYRAETAVEIGASDKGTKRIGEEVAAAQLQLLRSNDLARTVIQRLGLERRAAFVSAVEGGSIASDVLSEIGLGRDPTRISPEERMLETFAAHLSVAALDDTRVIEIAFISGDPQLAANAANAVATEYVALQAAAARDMAEEAMSTMQAEIARLRGAVAAAEARVEAYRAGIDRLSVSGPAADMARQNRAEAQLRAALDEIESEAVRQRELLDTYVRRYRDALARRQSGFLPVDAHILSRASAPDAPSFPRKGPIAATVGALSVLVMLVCVSIRARRRRWDRGGQVPLPAVADGRSTAVGGRWNDDGGVRRIMPGTPTFADIEIDAHIRESVLALARRLIGEGTRRIMVVTAGDEIDKCRPLAAVALARALARADRRPVLIDLRRDGADSLSMGEVADLPGFSDLLAGEASFGQVIFRDRKSRVHFIPAGSGRLPGQNLADGRIGLLVSALDHTYDHVVFDVAGDSVPLIGAVCDAVVVATAFEREDPRTGSLVERVQAYSQARIIVFQIVARAGESADLGFAKGTGEAAA